MAENKEFGLAILGTGGRAVGVIDHLLRESHRGVRVVSAYDPDPQELERALAHWEMPEARRCAGYQEAIATPGVDWVMVFSPNACHREQVEAAFRAGKDVFSEKPLATTLEDCRALYRLSVESGKRFATGFVLRYSPLYRKVKELLDSGRYGRLLAIDANENIAPEHGGYIMRNWRRFTRLAGPHILEKCCHDLDLLIWFTQSLPTRVAAFGGRDFFIPENQKLMDQYGERTFNTWRDPHAEPSSFTSEKDLLDTQVGIALFRNGVKVQFQATMSNAIPERRMYLSCTEGTLIAELYSGTLRARKLGEEAEQLYRFGADGHGGGDDVQMREFFAAMTGAAPIKCSGSEGLESAVFALALDRAMHGGEVVDLEPVWRELER